MKLDLQRLFQFINSKLNIVLSYIENAYIRNYSSKKFVYEIKDCHKNNDGKQIIVAKIVVCQELTTKEVRCFTIHGGRPTEIGQHRQISNDSTGLYLSRIRS
jgi:hypothetical protein